MITMVVVAISNPSVRVGHRATRASSRKAFDPQSLIIILLALRFETFLHRYDLLRGGLSCISGRSLARALIVAELEKKEVALSEAFRALGRSAAEDEVRAMKLAKHIAPLPRGTPPPQPADQN
jgi:hypothetical protein